MPINQLSSLWDGLSEHLIASFFVVEPEGDAWSGSWRRSQSETVEVRAPLSEANLEITLGWEDPFAASGAGAKAPTLMAMLQSGALQPVIDAVQGEKGGMLTESGLSDQISKYYGRTSITKLNSMQIFNAMQPIKINCTAVFRAWRDPVSEVEEPIDQLLYWAFPQELSKDGSIFARMIQTARGNMGTTEALMPSVAPLAIGMKYKNRTYAPLVIENISLPLSSPVNSKGHFIEQQVQLSLSSLSAIDRTDWSNTKTLIL